MTNLTRLVLDFENNAIGSEGAIILGETLITLVELDELDYNLTNNYIDNWGFEPMLENLKSMDPSCEIRVNVVLNNIVNVA